jgi:nucleotide sugar dehydrogenase
MPFHPGPGIGGHCIPVDPVYLNKIVRDNGLKISILDEALDSNRDIVTRTIKKIERTFNHESKAAFKIGILGIAYKADISDSRESPAIELIKRARAAGWSVIWNDDLVQEWNGEKSHSIEKILMDSDLVIACTIHSTVNKLRIIQDSQSKILDLTYKMPSSDKVIRL